MKKTLIETKQTTEYLMEIFKVDVSFGELKEIHFTRPNNVHDSLILKTIVRQWKDKAGKFRQNKRFAITRNGLIQHSIWANTRWNAELQKEYYDNPGEIKLFFQLWDQEKRLSDLELFCYGPKQDTQTNI